ncbi:MAG TPA: NAD(P)/FAD-dependent oxidoreductase [Candidatus Acidoferrales bacterium]|nr:NAD(P)/FAD-dependent oxidoreductase [Candidatus Acidoferrales bacterium]
MVDVVVIGAGIGGLLAAAKLSREFDVAIYERLPIIGGRFTNLPYKGFQLTTGALHMVPHGTTGPLSQTLKDIGAKVEIINSKPPATIRYDDGSNIIIRDLRNMLKEFGVNELEYLIYLAKIVLSGRRNNLVHILHSNPRFMKLTDAFCGWALSMNLAEVPASGLLAILRNILKYGITPGIPIGGCKAVIDAISQTVDGPINTNSEVEKIIVKGKKAIGIKIGGKFETAKYVISDIGPDATNKLLGLTARSEKPSAGIKISLSSNVKLIGHTGVLLTPYMRRIKGLNEATNADPDLAPPGKNLIMSYQPLQSNDLNEEIRLGFKDLKDLFKNNFELLLVQSYYNGWPVNRMASGFDAPNQTQYKNLYLVGDGAKKGGIEVEGVAGGVNKVVSAILK